MKSFVKYSKRIITLGDKEPLILDEINEINSDKEELVIQIFAHGGASGIQSLQGGNIIPWTAVVEALNNIQTQYPVRLDLTGVCNSHFIIGSLNADVLINSIWVTNRTTQWQSVYNYSNEAETFQDFRESLEVDEENARFIEYYRELLPPFTELN